MLNVTGGTAVFGLLAVLTLHGAPQTTARPASGRAATPAAAAPAEPAGFVGRYCLGCHDDRRQVAGLSLQQRPLPGSATDRAIWERVARQVRAGAMPPTGAPRPEPAAADAFAHAVEASLDRAYAAAPDPGRPVARRLTRTEYQHAIRDLLHLDIDTTSLLPADESLQGFQNVGSVLSLSPALLERYLAAARRISRLALGDPTIGPAFASTTYELPQTRFQDSRMSEDLPLGSSGGAAIRHVFPLDAEYVCRVRLMRNIAGYVRGLDTPRRLELRLDGVRLTTVVVGGTARGRAAPMGFTGVIPGDATWEAWAPTADDGLDVRFRATAGPHIVGVSFVDEPVEQEGVLQPALTGLGFSYSEYTSAPTGAWGPAVASVALDGPFDPTGAGTTPSRTQLLTCRPATPADEACPRQLLATLARRAFRRPATATELTRLMAFYTPRAAMDDFEAGMRAAVERLLLDPNFLFRIERDPMDATPGQAYALSSTELASRLSFFLWSSLPDDALLDAASSGALRTPQGLTAQATRLRKDGRSASLVEQFAMQWLSLPQLRGAAPDPELYPAFDDSLREAFLEETRLFIASQMRDDRSVVDLLTADYTFVNERLARHYGIPNITGSRFRRVPVNPAQRGGLLGHGSVLTITAYPTRTSPVLRGRWLLDTVFGTPPPPPPAVVPDLPGATENDRPLSMRERTERHRRNPVCASCHVRMDPLGFAMEQYDAVGHWRTQNEAGAPVDASGVLPDGTAFTGMSGLRTLIASRRTDVARTVTEKLLMYAIGRPLEPSDGPAVRRIVQEAAPGGYRWSAIIDGIVRSVPFRMRRAES